MCSDRIAGTAESAFTPGQTLAKVPIFSGLAENELSFLAQRALPRHYLAGEIIFGEGEPCSGLYVIESGHVRIFKSSASGREQVLSIDGPGSSMAELPVFDGGNYPASASAIDDAHLLFHQRSGNGPCAGTISFPSAQGKLQKHCGDCDLRVPKVPFEQNWRKRLC